MKDEVWQVARRLPSVEQFIERVTGDLRQGRSVVILLPPTINSALVWEGIRERLGPNYVCHELEVSKGPLQRTADIPCLAAAILGDKQYKYASFQEIVRNYSFPDVVWLQGIGECPESRRAGPISLLQEWAELTRSSTLEDIGTRALCVIEHTHLILKWLPGTDVHLNRHWWWGFPSSLELSLLCRQLSQNEEMAWAKWRECLVAGVAPGDLLLAEELLDHTPTDINSLMELLNGFGEMAIHNSPLVQVTQKLSRNASGVRMEPPASLRSEWANGAIVLSEEYGIELHPALLALGGGQHSIEEVEHRLWRGQAPFLLPVADQVRLRVATELTERYGKGWSNRWVVPLTESEKLRLQRSPLDAEFGYMAELFRSVGELYRLGSLRTKLVQAWKVRNELAHYEPVDWEQFKSFWQECR